jgi:hypothetical protein
LLLEEKMEQEQEGHGLMEDMELQQHRVHQLAESMEVELDKTRFSKPSPMHSSPSPKTDARVDEEREDEAQEELPLLCTIVNEDSKTNSLSPEDLLHVFLLESEKKLSDHQALLASIMKGDIDMDSPEDLKLHKVTPLDSNKKIWSAKMALEGGMISLLDDIDDDDSSVSTCGGTDCV